MSQNSRFVIEFDYTSEGADREINNLRKIQEATDHAAESGAIKRKSQEELSKANHKATESTRAAAGGMDRLGQSSKGAGDNIREANGSLPTLRYALYDVAQTAGAAAAAIGALGAATLVASASFESSFTAVERTSGLMGDQASALREELVSLTQQIPQSFAEIANIAARGAQLGIASDQIREFTDTVAQFVATSDTVTLDQAVEAFGRISNLLGDTDFNRIGSAITLVGVNAAATEAQIVKTTQELAPFATAVGMSTDEVIALAAALGSLGQPPERARSAFLTLQRVMDNAIASGSQNLTEFANLLGVTEAEVTKLWKQDPGAFVEAFAESLGSVDDLTTAFANLGINERRAVQVFQALAADARNSAGGVSVLSQAMSDAAQGYSEGMELARQYGLIVDDLASSWQFFLNSIQEFAATVGDALAPAAKAVLDFVTRIIQALSRVANTPFGSTMIAITTVLGGLAFIVFSLISTLALFTASLVAGSTALTHLNRVAGASIFTLKGLRGAFTEITAASGLSTRALGAFRVALASTGVGLAVLAVGTLATAFMTTAETAEETAQRYLTSTGGLAEAVQADTEAYRAAVEEGNWEVASSYDLVSSAVEGLTQEEIEANKVLEEAASILDLDVKSATDNVTGAIGDQTIALGDNVIAWSKNALMQSQAFQDLVRDQDFVRAWEAIGADFNTLMEIAASEGEIGVLNYFNRLAQATENGGGAYLQGLQLFAHRVAETFQIIGRMIEGMVSSLFSGNWEEMGAVGVASTAQLLQTWTTDALQKGFRDIAAFTPHITNLAREMGRLNPIIDQGADDLDNWADNTDNAGNAAKKAAREVRTLVDYADDLAAVWDRAFEIRFSGQQTLDQITTSFMSMRDAMDEARRRIRDLKNDIRGLSSDISIQEYFLGIAIEYGDTKRAAAIEAELARMRAQLADKSADLKKEQDAASTSLTGNTKGAIDNRKALTDLVGQYQSHVQALAASGLSSQELARRVEELRQDFIRQATQMGYNRQEVMKYAAAFDDMRVAIANIPRNITVKANANPAIQALNELRDMANRANTATNNLRSNLSRPMSSSINDSAIQRSRQRHELLAKLTDAQRRLSSATSGQDAKGWRTLIDRYTAQLRALGSYHTGGFTGSGGKYDPAGVVHRGEYVIPKRDVNQATGMPYADALGRLMTGVTSRGGGSAGVSSASSGVQTVALSAGTLEALKGMSNVTIMLDSKTIADSSSNQYAHGNVVGSN